MPRISNFGQINFFGHNDFTFEERESHLCEEYSRSLEDAIANAMHHSKLEKIASRMAITADEMKNHVLPISLRLELDSDFAIGDITPVHAVAKITDCLIGETADQKVAVDIHLPKSVLFRFHAKEEIRNPSNWLESLARKIERRLEQPLLIN